MKQISYTLLLLLLATKIMAQTNYRPGSITFANGGREEGWIDYREWEINPDHILFRARESSKEIRYGLTELSAFDIKDQASYRLASVSISQDKRSRLEDMNVGGPDKTIKTGTVFLKLVRDGIKLNLYEYTDNNKTRYYVRDNDKDQYSELIFQKYLTYKEPPQVATSNLFRNQLQAYTDKAPPSARQKLFNMLGKAEYSAASLSRIIDVINGRKDTGSKQRLHFYAGFSLYRSKGVYEGGYSFSEGSDVKTSYMPRITAGIDLFNKERIKRVIFRADISFTGASLGISKLEENGRTSTHNFKQYTVCLNPQIIYNFYNTENLKINAGTGLVFNVSTYDNEPVFIHKTAYHWEEKVNFAPVWLGIPVRAGIIVKQKFDIYAQYTMGGYITQGTTYMKIHTNAWQAGINILFW